MRTFRPSYKEGLEGKDTDNYTDPHLDKDPTYLAITNASNIAFLKGQLKDLTGLNKTVSTLNQKVENLTSKVENNSQAITALGESLKNTSQQLTGHAIDSKDPYKEPLPQATGLNYGNMETIQNSF